MMHRCVGLLCSSGLCHFPSYDKLESICSYVYKRVGEVYGWVYGYVYKHVWACVCVGVGVYLCVRVCERLLNFLTL